ncbi:MAG: PD40 domain-containing protein [Chloroflexi bacterium]|nr:PD40 domain-containing protein [Chloroflexota bacterium]
MLFATPKTAAQSGFLIILIFLLAACSAVTVTPQATVTSPPPPTLTSVPTITATPEPQQPPACAFPLAGTAMEESKPETYTFSEPRITARYGDIVSWLPDSQNVIIMTMEEHLFDGIMGHLQTIELFNTKTQAVQIYATRRSFGSKEFPAWNPTLNAIIYPAPNVLGLDKTTNHFIVDQQIRISYGNPDDTKTLAHDLPRYYISVKSDGSQVVYLENSDKQLYQLYSRTVAQGSLENEQIIPFNSDLFGHRDYPITYDTVWRPNVEQVFFKSPELGQSFLLDINTGKICALDFGDTTWGEKIWVIAARWSPNGRYLAMVRSSGGTPVDFSDLAVLDTTTGNLYVMAFSPDAQGRHYVWDITWAPDNYHLAAIGKVSAYQHCAPNCMDDVDRLYLVDFISKKADLIFPSIQFSSGSIGNNLAWSPDGTKILAQCLTGKQRRLCLISVHIGGQ